MEEEEGVLSVSELDAAGVAEADSSVLDGAASASSLARQLMASSDPARASPSSAALCRCCVCGWWGRGHFGSGLGWGGGTRPGQSTTPVQYKAERQLHRGQHHAGGAFHQ